MKKKEYHLKNKKHKKIFRKKIKLSKYSKYFILLLSIILILFLFKLSLREDSYLKTNIIAVYDAANEDYVFEKATLTTISKKQLNATNAKLDFVDNKNFYRTNISESEVAALANERYYREYILLLSLKEIGNKTLTFDTIMIPSYSGEMYVWTTLPETKINLPGFLSKFFIKRFNSQIGEEGEGYWKFRIFDLEQFPATVELPRELINETYDETKKIVKEKAQGFNLILKNGNDNLIEIAYDSANITTSIRDYYDKRK